ncbi:MAG: carbohydrate-binding family 9-like protein [Thermoanaerobaculia bacterium]|nr:carbohydrate-binding family 9-like protein [Thermoanaerobaculia bacterium]
MPPSVPPPSAELPRLPGRWDPARELSSLPWDSVPLLAWLARTEDGGLPVQATAVRLGWDPGALWARFDCDDSHPWATLAARDAPLWQEETVELFLAAGVGDPETYVEIEVNPLGALFDALVENPGLERAALATDTAFDWPGIRWAAGRRSGGWWAALALPWAGLPPEAGGPLSGPPAALRANLYRIDRPPGTPAEHSAWSPTLVAPADFHRPRRFGRLAVSGAGSGPPPGPDLAGR